jgi:hypothetical protein
MKTQSFITARTGLLLTVILFSIISCKKESIITANQQQSVSTSSADNIHKTDLINLLVGSYSVAGTRTLYIGDASDSVVNLVIDLSVYSPKTVTSLNATTLLCDYADLGYAGGIPLGWQYVITFYPAKKSFDVQPNDIMASQIIPGTWMVYNKKYNPIKRQFYFKTAYSNGSSGYDRITEETLTWQSK